MLGVRGGVNCKETGKSFGEDRNVLSLRYVGSHMDVGHCQNKPSGVLEMNAGI